MTQATRVFELDDAAAAALQERLQQELPPDAEWRPVPHARFSVKALGVIATCYRSGKLVVQGSSLDTFASRFLGDLTEPSKATPEDELPLDAVTIGSDETGKGDYFGPLVVAACHAGPDRARWLAETGATDSKLVDDRRALRLAARIEDELDHEIVVVDPPEYNRRWAAAGNLNILLGELHAQAIASLWTRRPGVELVIVDRFADERIVKSALRTAGVRPPRLVQVPRAERHPVVAAASILARAAFLEGLVRCSDMCGTDLHKGAGPPVDAVARRVYEIGGDDLLAQVAKIHFKNTAKLHRTR